MSIPPPNMVFYGDPSSSEWREMVELHKAWGQAWAAECNAEFTEKLRQLRIRQTFLIAFCIGLFSVLIAVMIFG